MPCSIFIIPQYTNVMSKSHVHNLLNISNSLFFNIQTLIGVTFQNETTCQGEYKS